VIAAFMQEFVLATDREGRNEHDIENPVSYGVHSLLRGARNGGRERRYGGNDLSVLER
jgi:hypothetical protein